MDKISEKDRINEMIEYCEEKEKINLILKGWRERI